VHAGFYSRHDEQIRILHRARVLGPGLLREGESLCGTFECLVPWGVRFPAVDVRVDIRIGWWSGASLLASLSVAPPADCERLARAFAAEAGLVLDGWEVRSEGPPGPEVLCAYFRWADPASAFGAGRLELISASSGYQAAMALKPRGTGVSGLVAPWERHVRHLDVTEEQALSQFRAVVEPLRRRYGAAGALPLPGGSPQGMRGTLPVPAGNPDEPEPRA
jgi:hypothetical protein